MAVHHRKAVRDATSWPTRCR